MSFFDLGMQYSKIGKRLSVFSNVQREQATGSQINVLAKESECFFNRADLSDLIVSDEWFVSEDICQLCGRVIFPKMPHLDNCRCQKN